MFACLHAPRHSERTTASLLEIAKTFSPSIEVTQQGSIVFSISGLGALIGTPHQIAAEIARLSKAQGIQANLAIAANPDAALYAARHLPGFTFLPPGKESEKLGALPLSQLAMPAEMHETLMRLGVRTFAGLASLPPLGVVERFGMEGLQLQDIARGSFHRPLQLARAAETLERRIELDHPLDNLEPLLFILNSMLSELSAEMGRLGLATTELRLQLDLADRPPHAQTVSFPVPVRDAAIMRKLLQLRLESHPPAAAIRAVTMLLVPTEPREAQCEFFVPTTPEPARLEITLDRIGGIVGTQNVGCAELLDTHRPDSYVLRPFQPKSRNHQRQATPTGAVQLVLRLYRPPLKANVMLERGYPSRVSAHGISGNVLNSSGPWRGSGDWWATTNWARDEWDVSLSDGGLYRIFLEKTEVQKGIWFIAGVFD